MGIDDYVTKPYHPKELIARINVHLEKSRVVKKLAQINGSHDKFLIVLGHDLKNAFTSLHSNIHLLNSLRNSPEYDDMLMFAKSHTHYINDLLDQLLLWGRMINEGIFLKTEIIDLDKISAIVIDKLNKDARRKNVMILHQPSGESFILADRFMIETVIRNLLINAIRFTKPGKGVTISTHNVTQQDQIELCISDSGIGMTKEKLATLFSGTYNTAETDTEGKRGMGLGLSICKEFIQKNCGRIDVYSKSGEGSSFVVTLPKANKKMLTQQQSMSSFQ
jgi:signal transduction histidine kinase